MKLRSPPSQRKKQRYVVFQLEGAEGLDQQVVRRAIWGVLLQFLGELGVSKLEPELIEWQPEGGKGVARVSHRGVDEFRVSLCLLRKVEDRDVLPMVVGVSGTMRKARTKFLGCSSRPH